MAPLGIAVVGCGGIARTAHLPAIRALAHRVRLVAVADVDRAAAEAAAGPFGAAACPGHRAVLDRPDVAAVLVATPEAFHAEQAIAAAEAGRHVLCEKPIARTLEEADAIIAACERAGVVLFVAHSRRFTRRYLEVARLLGEGRVGTVRLVRENERRPRGFGPGGERTFRPGHWTGETEGNAGIALLAGIHEADVLRWFAGAEPVSVFARQAVTTPGNRGVPDFMSMTVRLAGGAVGASEIGRMVPPGYPAFHQLELYGTEGAVRARDHEMASFVVHGPEGAREPDAARLFLSGGSTYVRQLAAFLDAVEGVRPPPVSPEDARTALALALAAVLSAREGRPVDLAPAGAAP